MHELRLHDEDLSDAPQPIPFPRDRARAPRGRRAGEKPLSHDAERALEEAQRRLDRLRALVFGRPDDDRPRAA